MKLFTKQPALIEVIDEENIKTNPFAKIVRILLDKALEAGGRMVVFGIPAGADWNWDRELEKRSHDGNERCELLFAGTTTDIPVWVEIGGKFHRHSFGIPRQMYFKVLNMFVWLKVSVETAEGPPMPARCIELLSKDPSSRRFAEVEMGMWQDNTIRVQIINVFESPEDVKAIKRI